MVGMAGTEAMEDTLDLARRTKTHLFLIYWITSGTTLVGLFRSLVKG